MVVSAYPNLLSRKRKGIARLGTLADDHIGTFVFKEGERDGIYKSILSERRTCRPRRRDGLRVCRLAHSLP